MGWMILVAMATIKNLLLTMLKHIERHGVSNLTEKQKTGVLRMICRQNMQSQISQSQVTRQSYPHFIWKARNEKMCAAAAPSIQKVFAGIRMAVKYRLMGVKGL